MKKAVWLLALTLSATTLVACGGDDSEDGGEGEDPTTFCPQGDQTSPGGGGETLVVKADPSGKPRLKPTSLTAEAGELTLKLDNPSPRCHDLAVKGEGGENFGNTERVKQGTASVGLDLDPGEYTYYSTIPDEQEAGMLGTLTVK